MDTRLALHCIVLFFFGLLSACKGSPDEAPWCSDAPKPPLTPEAAPLTYYHDVKPILDAKCVRCHTQGGIAPTVLSTHGDAFAQQDLIRLHVADRTMPPWLAARCCTDYFQDFSLTDDEIKTVLGWVDQGGPGGDPTKRTLEVFPEIVVLWSPVPFNGESAKDRRVGVTSAQLGFGVAYDP